MGRLFGLAPVAFHDLRAANAELAILTDTNLAFTGLDINDAAFGTGERQANAARLPLRKEWRRMRNRRGLRKSVALSEGLAGDRLERADYFHREGAEPLLKRRTRSRPHSRILG